MCVIALLATSISLQQRVTENKAPQRGFRFGIVQNDKIGFIDENGTVVIKPQFVGSMYGGTYFSEGLAPVLTNDWWVYIDESGKLVLRTTFDSAGSFSEGLAPICVAQTRVDNTRDDLKCGYVDKTGKIVIAPRFDKAGVFRDGLARVY